MAENILPWVSFFIRRDFRFEIGDLINEKECLANDYDYFIRCTKRSRPPVSGERTSSCSAATAAARWSTCFRA